MLSSGPSFLPHWDSYQFMPSQGYRKALADIARLCLYQKYWQGPRRMLLLSFPVLELGHRGETELKEDPWLHIGITSGT